MKNIDIKLTDKQKHALMDTMRFIKFDVYHETMFELLENCVFKNLVNKKLSQVVKDDLYNEMLELSENEVEAKQRWICEKMDNQYDTMFYKNEVVRNYTNDFEMDNGEFVKENEIRWDFVIYGRERI